jgi:ribosomal protein S18 acetylase RimI-like enzyme
MHTSELTLVYKVHHLSSSDPDFEFLAGKYAALRLQALTVSPGAFGSTFEHESAHPPSLWVSRLKRPNVHTFIAVAYPSTFTAEQQTIAAGDFVGSMVMLGPVPRIQYRLPLSNGAEIGSDDVETKWHLTALFNSFEHRRKGIAKMLINSAVDFSTKEGGTRSRVRLVLHPLNTVVKSLYLPLGFVDAGNCTFTEAVIANGDDHLLPPDGGQSDPERYHTRGGILMEKVTEFQAA